MLQRENKQTVTNKRQQQMRENACSLIRDNLHNSDYSLEDLANSLHISTRQLQRILRKLDSGGFRNQIYEERMAEAARLLSDGHSQVTEVAAKVGYKHPMHFSKAFRRQYNFSPRQWRNYCAKKRILPRQSAK